MKRLKRGTIPQQVAEHIREHIVSEGLRPGDRLPTEQDLADRFGVSRISVREATKALGFIGVIESAPKRGLTVGQMDMERAVGLLGFQFAVSQYPKKQLLQARLVVEAGAMPYTMERFQQDPAIHRRLLALVESMDPDGDVEEIVKQDLAFHRELLAASGIEPLVAYSDLLSTFFERFHNEVVHARIGRGKLEHRKMLDALRDENLSLAQATLRKHLSYSVRE